MTKIGIYLCKVMSQTIGVGTWTVGLVSTLSKQRLISSLLPCRVILSNPI